MAVLKNIKIGKIQSEKIFGGAGTVKNNKRRRIYSPRVRPGDDLKCLCLILSGR